MLRRRPTIKRSVSPIYPLATYALAAVIFSIDTFTSLDAGAIAVSYVVVVMLSASFLGRNGVLATAGLCVLLTLGSYAIVHGHAPPQGSPVVRCLTSLCAILITTLLTLRNLQVTSELAAQAELLELTHDAIFVRDNNDVITYWNHGAEEGYGWTADQAIGQRAMELLGTRFPAARDDIQWELQAAGRWEGELTHTKRDGTEVVVASRWSLQRDERGRPVATLEINNDITDRKRAYERLRLAEQELRQAINTIPAMIWSISAGDGRTDLLNVRCSDLDLPPTGAFAGQWRSVVHPDDVEQIEAGWADALATGAEFESACRVRLRSGEYRWLLVRAAPLRDETGRILRWYGINTDIEEQRRAEDALYKARVELSHVTRVATLGELTASIAHEVNQPLAAVVTNGEAGLRWLSREVPDLNEVRQSVERVIADGRRAGQVIANLRKMARNSEPEHTSLNINEVVDDVLLLVRREMLEHRVGLALDLDPSLPAVLGDRVQLQQVIINLVLNAIQAMSSVNDRDRMLSISSAYNVAEEDNFVVLSVQDSGAGIDPSSVSRLFTAFYTTKSNGMGMGLSICRSIVEAHGGQISLDTEVTSGARFVIRLPVPQEVDS